MNKSIKAAITTLLVVTSVTIFAQVPPDIAAGIRKIGPIIDPVNTAKLYAPLFANQKEPYPDVNATRDVAYGSDPLQTMDVFTSGEVPAGKLVVIYVHGGGFERGDKRQAGTPFYDNLMLWVTQQGMVGVNINYRLAPQHSWPAAHEDVASVIRWVKSHITQYGGDPDRVVLWGNSAGANLIAGYLTHQQFHGQDGHGVRGAILTSGTSYLLSVGSTEAGYFGNDPIQLEERSSLEGMKKLDIPLLLTQSEVDLPKAINMTQRANHELREAGRFPVHLVLRDHNHVSQNFSIGTADTSLSGPVLQFLRGIK